jgi:hypothetical protein
MSAGNPFSQIAAGQDGQNTAPSPSATGNPFSAIAATLQPTIQQPTGIARLWTSEQIDPNAPPTPSGGQQLTDAAIGAGKSLVKGLGNIGDVATLGLTHLLPGSDKASAGIGATGTTLQPSNEDQRYGGFAGEAATFELGNSIFESLSHLPLAERLLQSAKALKAAQEHPVLASIAGNAVKGAAEAGSSTLIATGDPKTAAAGAAVGGTLGVAGQGVKAVREIYRDLPTAESVQPVLQDGIRDAVAKTAADAGVEASDSSSIRDVIADTAENVKEKSQPVFQRINELSNGEFSDAQAQAQRYRGSVDKAGKDAYDEAIASQNQIFDSVKSQMEPDALATAKANWKQYNALSDVSDALQNSTSGTRPEIAAASKAEQPAETVNPKQLLGKLNKLYNDNTLQTALGDNAHALLDHAGASQAKLTNIADALTAQKSKQRTVAYVGKRAAIGTAEVVGGGAVLKALGVLGGKH